LQRLGDIGRASEVSLVTVFAAAVAIATVSFSVSVPATRGYFNIGETAIYVSALLFGASVGGLSAGIGSMIADLILGYALFAPATLVIKGIEGAIVGSLGRRREALSQRLRRSLAAVTSIALGTMILVVGSCYYTGSVEFTLASPLNPISFKADVPLTFWIVLASVTAVSILYVSLKYDPSLNWEIVAVLVGGAEMVAGYFLYEQLILGVAAVVEIPVNIGQMMIGAVVAIPLVRAVRARIPQTVTRNRTRSPI